MPAKRFGFNRSDMKKVKKRLPAGPASTDNIQSALMRPANLLQEKEYIKRLIDGFG